MRNNKNLFIKYNNLLILFLILIVKLSYEDINDKNPLINEIEKDAIKNSVSFITIIGSGSIGIGTNKGTLDTNLMGNFTTIANNSDPGNVLGSLPLNKTEEEYLNKIKKLESKGLSTGGILGLVIPCALALIAGIVAAALCPCRNTPAPFEQSTIMGNTPRPIDSTMDNLHLNTQIQPPVKQEITPQIVPTPIPVEVSHSIYNINKVNPPIPNVNRVFEPLYPSQRFVTVNQPVPTSQVVQVNQVAPQISKITEVQAAPQISQTIEVNQTVPEISTVAQVNEAPQISQPMYVSEPEPKMISTSKIVSPPQVLPETQTTHVNPPKVLPPKYLPKIRGQTQVMPPKVLPLVDRGTKASSAIETIPYNARMEIASSQLPLTSEVVNTPVSAINEPITSQMNLISSLPQTSQITQVENIPFTHVPKASDNIVFKSETHEIIGN